MLRDEVGPLTAQHERFVVVLEMAGIGAFVRMLPSRVHEALIKTMFKDRIVGHISRDATAIEVREKYRREYPALKQPRPGNALRVRGPTNLDFASPTKRSRPIVRRSKSRASSWMSRWIRREGCPGQQRDFSGQPALPCPDR